MPVFEGTTVLAHSPAEVFDFICKPANLIAVTPPDLNMRLVEAPERLSLGARIVLQSRRWGFSQRIVSLVTAFDPNRLIADEQKEGPFKKWVHSHRLEAIPEGTRMIDRIEYEAPGGLLGLVFTTDAIENELQELFAYRTEKFKELLPVSTKPAT
jgi:ligand-binding SRPBCC domain-containing protein